MPSAVDINKYCSELALVTGKGVLCAVYKWGRCIPRYGVVPSAMYTTRRTLHITYYVRERISVFFKPNSIYPSLAVKHMFCARDVMRLFKAH